MPVLESIALSGLGWVASPIVSKLINDCFSKVGMDVPQELAELHNNVLPKLSLVSRTMHSSFKELDELTPWLQSLQNAYYEAEDLIDKAEYQRLDHENKKSTLSITSQRFNKAFAKLSCKAGSNLDFFSPQKNKLWHRLIKLKNTVKTLVDDAKTFRELLQNTTTINANVPSVPVTSSQLLNKVFGRDKDRDHIVKQLMQNKSYLVVAIVRSGGAGKTTLAEYVFNDERVRMCFDMRIWVCLSRKLDVIEHTKEMIRSATKKDCSQSNLRILQYNLSEILRRSKNILLVLDDIWYDNTQENSEDDWKQLMAPFTSARKYCILLTSRSRLLPVALHTRYPIDLKDLEEDELVSLFEHMSGLNQLPDARLRCDLHAISVQIVAKLGRSPLATKAVAGRFLRMKPDVDVWRDELTRAYLRDTTDPLVWSFQHLKEAVQRCFLHCSAYPKGFIFTKDELIRKWRVLNFIQSVEDDRNVEEIGEEYFNELRDCFFFEPFSNETVGDLRYRIHHNFHDLADRLSRNDYHRIEDNRVIEIIPPTVRHLTLHVSNIGQHAPSISRLKNLRSLIVLVPLEEDTTGVLEEILGNSKKLRILELAFCNTNELPKLVFDLKYLRMLNIHCTSLNRLPEALLKLYLLQTLVIPNSVTDLPRMRNLINLRDIIVFDKHGQLVDKLPRIRDVGKLTSLQKLSEFHVSKEIGCEIQQLGELRQLGGLLRITGLENVGENDAPKAKLVDKKRLETLYLIWSPSSNEINSDKVINSLQPPSNLKDLIIKGYAGAKYPVWCVNSNLQILRQLELVQCNALYSLPSNIQSWESLRNLVISECPSLVFKSNEDLPPNEQKVLTDEQSVKPKIAPFVEFVTPGVTSAKEQLRLECESFKQISKGREGDFSKQIQVLDDCIREKSPGINQLEAWWPCHTERIKFIFSSSVQENQLKSISNLRVLNLNSCNITDGALSNCLSTLTSLEELQLRGIMSLTTLPSEEILEHLKSLRVLKIHSCWLLRSLGAVYALPSLEKLALVFCPSLDMKDEKTPMLWSNFLPWSSTKYPISGLPSSLQSLEICVASIPSGTLSIGHLSSLRSLKLFNCTDIRVLEGLHVLFNLEKLRLTKIPHLEIKESLPKLSLWCTELEINNMRLLKLLFSSALFTPRDLTLEYVEDEVITFNFEGAELQHLTSVEFLRFYKCRTKSLPISLRTTFPSLKKIVFEDCPQILLLPELPESVKEFIIKAGCPQLKERCSDNGEDWQKIAHIPKKYIE